MATNAQEQEYTVRLPAKNDKKAYHIMKFHANTNNDPAKWSQVRMIRENNRKDFKGPEEEMPKFGAGSEFGRDEREEARRKKFGFASRKYKPDNQPWLMRVGSKKEGKHYKGTREGGVSENTAYYVFTHAQDGSFEAHPVKEWYNFVPRVTHKTYDVDEAEEKFAERGKILNHWALVVNRKLRPNQLDKDEDLDEDETKKGKKSSKQKKDLKISDMDDDYFGSDNDIDSDDEEDEEKADNSDSEKKDKKGKNAKNSKGKKKKKSKDVDDEAFEDSDDGEDEGREVDYMSDESSEAEEEVEEKYQVKGVDQDEGLAKMLDSDSDEDEEEKAKEENEDEDEEEDGDKKKKKKKAGEEGGSDDEKNSGKKSAKSSANNSRATTPTPETSDEKTSRAEKRKAMVDKLLDPNAEPSSKKSRLDNVFPGSSTQPQGGSVEASFEDDVRRYLARKPMTTTEILRKIKSKKTGLAKDELMPLLVNVLKRINPHKQKVKGTMYLSLKSGK